jgi:hypothetical protein
LSDMSWNRRRRIRRAAPSSLSREEYGWSLQIPFVNMSIEEQMTGKGTQKRDRLLRKRRFRV